MTEPSKSRRLGLSSLSDHLGKLPPQAVEIEEAILGALMLEREAAPQVFPILSPEDFYRDAHQEIYAAIMQLFGEANPIDIKTVTHQLRKGGKLELVGGAHYVAELTTRVNSAANIEYHARVVAEQGMKRELIRISSEIQKEVYEDTTDVFKMMDKGASDLLKVSMRGATSYTTMSCELMEVLEEIQRNKKLREENQSVGVLTGLKDLDRKTGGFKGGNLILVAARPGMGKTAFVNTCIRNMSVDYKEAVGFMSLEMTNKETVMREVAMESGVSIEKLQNGTYFEEDFDKIFNASNVLSNGNVLMDDTPGLNPYQIRSKAMHWKRKYDIKVLFFDYVQLGTDDNTFSVEERISNISATLKGVAKDLNIPVIALSQLSRQVEQRGGDKRPLLSDLRSSGSLEQDADMVLFLYRPEYYEKENCDPEFLGKGEIIIAKYRNGKPAKGWFKFIGRTTKWDNLDEFEDDDDFKPRPDDEDKPF